MTDGTSQTLPLPDGVPRAYVALLHSDQFQAAVTGLGGYSAKEMGRRLR